MNNIHFVALTKRLLNDNAGRSEATIADGFDPPTGSDDALLEMVVARMELASMPKADKSGIAGRVPEAGTGKRMSMSWDVESW